MHTRVYKWECACLYSQVSIYFYTLQYTQICFCIHIQCIVYKNVCSLLKHSYATKYFSLTMTTYCVCVCVYKIQILNIIQSKVCISILIFVYCIRELHISNTHTHTQTHLWRYACCYFAWWLVAAGAAAVGASS